MTGWRQFVYTSADLDDGTRGGWGIKLADPDDFRVAAQAVLATVDTRLFTSEDVGDFPTADVLERRNRQLTARQVGTRRLLIHAVAAGADATGRPGNVFVHAAETDVAGPTAIEYWRSASWLTPFGPAAVNNSKLPSMLSAGDAVSRRSVATFLSQPGRLSLLAVLSERLAAVQLEGGTVVLLVDSPNEAAEWFAALTFVRDVRSDHEVSWTTWSRVETLTAMREAKVHVVAVPRAEGGAAQAWVEASRDGSIVLDSRSSVYRDGQVWKMQDGAVVAEHGTDSNILTSVQTAVDSFGPDLLADLLDEAHALTAESSDDYDDPLWAFSAAALTDPDVTVADRRDQTQTLIAAGPRRQRPSLIDSAVDDWWRADSEGAARILDGDDVFGARDLLVRRRVVLLLAGELEWSDEVDGRLELRSVDAIADELSNARQRVDGLLLHRTLLDEAATIIRVFTAYGVGLELDELNDLRDRLVECVELIEEPMRSEILDRARPPVRRPRLTSEPLAAPIYHVERSPLTSAEWPSETRVALPETLPEIHSEKPDRIQEVVPSTDVIYPWPDPTGDSAVSSWEAPADHAPPRLSASRVEVPRSSLDGLVNRWIEYMLRDLPLLEVDATTLRQSITDGLIDARTVAEVLCAIAQRDALAVIKRAAKAAKATLDARPPFDIVASPMPTTDNFAYELVVESCRILHQGALAGEWGKHAMSAGGLFAQAWAKTGDRR